MQLDLGAMLMGAGAAADQGEREVVVEAKPASVAEVIARAAGAVKQLGVVWLEAEVAQFKRPASGHLYFTLQDAAATDGAATISAVMWRSAAQRLRFDFVPGMRIEVRGKLDIYARDGKFQLYVEWATPAGEGLAALKREALRKQLASEGLFDDERKRPLPLLPRRIGVVTSASGAAVVDIIQTVQRRCPVPILVADCLVQGPQAPQQIAMALRALATTDVEVIIVGRGGGASTDLAAFDDELVVRAVAASPVPVIAAVGHEVDVSLTDLVADVRASTPTAAAELAVPVAADLRATLEGLRERAEHALGARLVQGRDALAHHGLRLQQQALGHVAARSKELAQLRSGLDRVSPRAQLLARRQEFSQWTARLAQFSLGGELDARRAGLEQASTALAHAMTKRLQARRADFSLAVGKLDAMSPLQVLLRGYAIASRPEADGTMKAVRAAAEVAIGEALHVRVADGSLWCEVTGYGDAPAASGGAAAGASGDAPAGTSAAAGGPADALAEPSVAASADKPAPRRKPRSKGVA